MGQIHLTRPLGNTQFREWSDSSVMTREKCGIQRQVDGSQEKTATVANHEGEDAKETKASHTRTSVSIGNLTDLGWE